MSIIFTNQKNIIYGKNTQKYCKQSPVDTGMRSGVSLYSSGAKPVHPQHLVHGFPPKLATGPQYHSPDLSYSIRYKLFSSLSIIWPVLSHLSG